MLDVSEPTHILLDATAVQRALSRVAHEIRERNHGVEHVVLVGIRSRGVHLAHRIQAKLAELTGQTVPVGSIDITAYVLEQLNARYAQRGGGHAPGAGAPRR